MSKTRSFLNLRSGRPVQAPAPGEIAIDGYRIEELLGTGPLTAVYRAVLESHQQEVAVKVLLPHLADSEVFAQRFLQAANSARMVTHDRVLPCYDVGQANGWVYLAGELVEGRSLTEIMGSGSMDNTRAVYLAWQVAMGLEAIHAAGLVHGNLRPSNVLVDEEDGVRLADLGLPVLTEADPASSPATAAALHLPPESSGRECVPDAAGDIYALGVILFGLVLGRTPWSGISRQRLLEAHAAGTPVLTEAPAQLDGDLQAVLARATARRADDRYRHVFQLREDLERLQYGFAPIHARSVQPAAGSVARDPAVRSGRGDPPSMAPAQRQPRRYLVPALALGLAAVAGLVWLAVSGRSQAPPQPVATPPPAAAVVVPPPERGPSGPAWAAASGVDAYGRWADLDVHGVRQRFRLIKSGSFWMGSAADEAGRAADEDRHLVTLSRDFWLADSETPQDFFVAQAGTNPSHFQGGALPVESLNWNGAQDFLARLGGATGAPVRLPSEAEWEYACRAGRTGTVQVDTAHAWTAASGLDAPKPVRTSQPNAWGLYDLQGNVAEWVEDTYGRFKREPASDPVATGGIHRVIRGGAWNLDPGDARESARGKALPTTAYFHLGFRIAISEAPPR